MKINKQLFFLADMLLHHSLNITDLCYTRGVKHNKIFFILTKYLYPDYIISTFYIINMVHLVCNLTYIGCFIVIRVRGQNEYRLVIYVDNTLCPGRHRKKKLGTLSHMAHTSLNIVCTMSSSGCKIVVLEQIKLPTYYLEFHEKSKCLTSLFYLIIGMTRRLPKKWYIIYCVYNEPKLHNTTTHNTK